MGGWDGKGGFENASLLLYRNCVPRAVPLERGTEQRYKDMRRALYFDPGSGYNLAKATGKRVSSIGIPVMSGGESAMGFLYSPGIKNVDTP